jgi:probable blue pigment (indigoidine) exporter
LTSRSIFPAAPGIAAAVVLGVADILVKIIAAAHGDVFRAHHAVVPQRDGSRLHCGVAMARSEAADRWRGWISLGIGVLFAVLIFCLFKAMELNDVPTAVLSYFVSRRFRSVRFVRRRL